MANIYTDQLRLRMPTLGDTGWDDELNDNIQILEVFLAAAKQGNSVVSGLAPSDGGGLQVDYAAGVADVGDAKRTIGASNKTCTAAVKNWLYVNNAGTVVISTTAPTGDFCPIAMIDAGGAAIDRIADLRFFGEVHIGYKSDGMRFAADAEASDTYVITLSPVPAAYYTGMVVNFSANTANTGAATLNVNALGAKTIKKNHDQDLATGDIESGQMVTVIYDGTNFQMQSQPAISVYDAIKGDGTPGRVLRTLFLDIRGTVDANDITIETNTVGYDSGWNSDTHALETLTAGDDDANWYFSANGIEVYMNNAAITGTPLFAMAIVGSSGLVANPPFIRCEVVGGEIQFHFRAGGASLDLRTLGNGEEMQAQVLYLTDA